MKKNTLIEFYQVQEQYIEELYFLQVELLKLQKYVSKNKLRLAILFEGRDTAGKGAAIFRFTQFLNPREYRIVALAKPTEIESGQWYFQRYIKELPNPGEIVFFDRSWYNRAIVEPVMGFCSMEEYDLYMKQVKPLEKMLVQDGIVIVKFWFSIDKEKQSERINDRIVNPLKKWKVSPVDLAAQQKWDDFSNYKTKMFDKTHTSFAPWLIIRSENREESRINCMKYILNLFEYEDKPNTVIPPNEIQLFPYSTFENN